MPVATIFLNDSAHYGKEAFADGLARNGYVISFDPHRDPNPDDLIVVWNRHGSRDAMAKRYEKVGGRALVIENGWIGGSGKQGHLFAICLHQHNGPGKWFVGEEDRWTHLGIELAPWRRGGRHVLVLPQRGIGSPKVAMPRDWVADVTRRLSLVTSRAVRVRPHPGAGKWNSDMGEDLKDAYCVVTWASGGAIKSIVDGVPVFHELDNWIGSLAARFGIDNIDAPFLGDRGSMLHRLAWAQWTQQEIAAGTPFKWLR